MISFNETFTVGGTTGENEDVVELFVSQYGSPSSGTWGTIAFDGSAYGLSSIDLRGLDVVPTSGGASAAAAGSLPEGESARRLPPMRPIESKTVNSVSNERRSANGAVSSDQSSPAERRQRYAAILARLARLRGSAASNFRSVDQVRARLDAASADVAVRLISAV